MKAYTQGFIAQGIIAVIALILIASGAYYVSKKEVNAPNPTESGTTDPRWHWQQGEPGDSEYLTPLQTLEIAQKVAVEDFRMNISKECLDFDGIRESGFVTYNVSRKFGNGCPEKNLNADYPVIPKIKVDLKTGEAFSGTLSGWKPFVTLKTYTDLQNRFTFQYPANWIIETQFTNEQYPYSETLLITSPENFELYKVGKETSYFGIDVALKVCYRGESGCGGDQVDPSRPTVNLQNGIVGEGLNFVGMVQNYGVRVKFDDRAYHIDFPSARTGRDLSLIQEKILSSFTFIPSRQMNVTIYGPADIASYDKTMNEYIFADHEGVKNPAPVLMQSFVPQQKTIKGTDKFTASAEAAALQIHTQGGAQAAKVDYFRIIDTTAYILLHMELDGWAGVSVSSAKIQPLVEKTLLQFPEIKSVKFQPAPGDTY